jgi:hypothetical protein
MGGEERTIVAFVPDPAIYSEPLMSRTSAAVLFGALLHLATQFPTTLAGDKAAAEVSYFFGESKMTTPDGKPFRTSLSLVKRVVDPARGRIEEHVLSINERDTRAFVVILEVKGNRFTVRERYNAFSGEGELICEPWKWKGWKSVTKLAGDAGTVTSVDRITDQGLSVKKSYAGADRKVRFLFEESLRAISPKTYDILYARLAPAKKAGRVPQ